jgi:hypothetical protein
MNPTTRPPSHVPTLTEVIDLLAPSPFNEEGLQTMVEPEMQPVDAALVVSSGLARPAQESNWTPMSTVVLGAFDDREIPPILMREFLAPQAETIDPVCAAGFTEAQLAQRVLADVQRQVDGLLDFRLREAIGPILARHSEALVRDLRDELERTMRDVVARSVSQEMAKLRQR